MFSVAKPWLLWSNGQKRWIKTAAVCDPADQNTF